MIDDIKNEYLKVCKLVDENEVISFDIYDTALLRNVLYPTDIFDIVSKELEKKDIYIKNFKKFRIESEESARKYSKFEDISFDDIYQIISLKLGGNLSNKVKELELQIEKKFTIANPFIKKIYDYAISKEKKIIFISDMYLPQEFITELLIKNGFSKFENIFVSGSVGVSKATTKLYHHIKQVMAINDKWLHIGDNFIADYKNAISSNINAYYYKDTRKRVEIKKKYSIEYSIMKAIQINYSETWELNYWQRFGVNIVSSLFYGFMIWLTNEVKGKDNIYFLSRDGYLPYQLYKKFFKNINNLPEPRYLYASRRAYQIPNIINMSQNDAIDLLTVHNQSLGQKITLGEVFDNIGLKKEKYYKVIKQYGFSSFVDSIEDSKDKERAKEVLRSIYSDIIQIFKEEENLLKQYLSKNKIFEFYELNIVDIGWRGSTQKAIKDITNITTNGYYLGIADNVYEDIKNYTYGYAFNKGKPYKNMRRIMNNVMMYELIFSAPHGSLIGFNETNGHIEPILKEIENNVYLYDCIGKIHTSVINITDYYMDYYEYLKDIHNSDCLVDYFEFIDKKKIEDLKEFSHLTGVVGIGSSQNYQNFVSCITIQDYYNNRSKVENEISKNLWKNALIVTGSINDLQGKKFLSRVRSSEYIIYLTKEKILRAIKNPKKAVKFILNKIKF